MKVFFLLSAIAFVQVYSSEKTVFDIFETLRTVPDLDAKKLNDLTEVFKKMKSPNLTELERVSYFATVLTLSVRDDMYKTSETAVTLFDKYHERAVELKSSGRNMTLEETPLLLSDELSVLKVEEAINNASAGLSDEPAGRKVVDYVTAIFHNALGVSKRLVCDTAFATDICKNYAK
ncbi:uncharacterized protein LOC116345990 [Contarinia nasturtii]|uniref:uncharacterized protein LOC116345990 n=1 Tax=Contarinia nasturtii TaxID=265458 RepID=UPI0012D3CCF1|nr:uncharacterized protein LOC116345990 [Contarinia nasturtii]